MKILSINILVLFLFLACAHSGKSATGNYPEKLPEFTLKDAHGKSYASKDLMEKHLIIVLTAPTLKNKSAQEGWSNALESLKNRKDITLIFLEDMQPSNFKEQARQSMKEESKPREQPILLIDPNGDVRQKFKVKSNETVLLVYQKNGHLVLAETQEPSPEAAARILQALDKKK